MTFAENKIPDLSAQLFHKLTDSLKILNFSDNKVKHIPNEVGSLKALRVIHMHGNRFTSFPCSIVNLIKSNLEELSLEWFLYAKPPRPKLVKKGSNDG